MSNSNPAESDSLSLRKLLLGLVLTVILFLVLPMAFAFLRWTAPLSPKGSWVLAIIAGGIVVKMLAGDFASGEFLFHKFGYDNCIMTLSALVTAIALQLSSKGDLFPGFAKSAFLSSVSSLTDDVIMSRVIILFTFFVIVLICTLLTARICLSIKKDKAAERRGLALLNAVVGVIILCSYIFILVGKG